MPLTAPSTPRPTASPPIAGEREYRLAPGWRVLFGALALALLAGGLALGAWPIVRSAGSRPGLLFGGGAFLSLLGAWFLISMRSRVTLGRDAIALEEPPFISRRLRRVEILGWRRVNLQYGMHQLVLVPRGEGLKPVKISSLYRTDQAFAAWVAALPSLDLQESLAEEEALRAELSADGRPAEPDIALRWPRRVARVLNGLALGVSLWTFLWPRPYPMAVASAFILPVLAVVAAAAWPGLVTIDERRNDPRPSVGLAFLGPGMVLALRALLDVNLVATADLVAPGVAAGLALGGAAVLADGTLRRRRWAPLLIACLTVGWGYGAVVQADVLLDHAAPTRHLVTVTAKRLASGKDHRRLLVLQPWGPISEHREVSVSTAVFRAVEPGQEVQAELHPGALGVAWYVVRAP